MTKTEMNEFCFIHFLAAPLKNLIKFHQNGTKIQWMNERPLKKKAYTPTVIEHVANIITHGVWVIPAVLGGRELLMRSNNNTQLIAASVYSLSLLLLFIVSTSFHSVHFCNNNERMKVVLHRCDRAMIYIFIAASYFPWLYMNLEGNKTQFYYMSYVIWIMAAMGIAYQQLFHERYKILEIIFYVIMGVGPYLVIIGTDVSNIQEIKAGGAIYLSGILFFKLDGRIPCAHAIWHIFVVVAAGFHYYAILTHLFPELDDNEQVVSSLLDEHASQMDSHVEL